jgi:hypothetical protein
VGSGREKGSANKSNVDSNGFQLLVAYKLRLYGDHIWRSEWRINQGYRHSLRSTCHAKQLPCRSCTGGVIVEKRDCGDLIASLL